MGKTAAERESERAEGWKRRAKHYEQALRFYADDGNWIRRSGIKIHGSGPEATVSAEVTLLDGGERARETLRDVPAIRDGGGD